MGCQRRTASESRLNFCFSSCQEQVQNSILSLLGSRMRPQVDRECGIVERLGMIPIGSNNERIGACPPSATFPGQRLQRRTNVRSRDAISPKPIVLVEA
jgi:hypothetical protein